jgi:hypothetical protein
LAANIKRYHTTKLDGRGLEYYQSSIYVTLNILTGWQRDCAGAWRMMLCSPTGNALLKSSIPLLEELYGIISPAQIGEFPGRGRTQTCLKIMLAYAASDGRFDEQGFLDCSELDQIVNKYDPKFHPEAYPDDYKFQQALAVIQWARRGTCLNIGCPDTYDASYAKLCSQCKLARFCGEKVSAHSSIVCIFLCGQS